MNDWPKHPDGQNMKMGEMSADQRKAIVRRACDKLQAEFATPDAQAQFSRILNVDPPQRMQ